MTSHTFPFDIDAIDPSRNGGYGLLIRHGKREPITRKVGMLEAQLTAEGRTESRALGRRLRELSPNLFCSSPVQRCIDTNCCILEGLGMDKETARQRVVYDLILAEGFMADPAAGKEAFRRQDPEQLILDYLAGKPVPGFCSVEEGAVRLLNFVRDALRPGTLSVFVTHDALVMPFRQHFLGDTYSRDRWAPPLGGCVIYTEGDRTWIDGRAV